MAALGPELRPIAEALGGLIFEVGPCLSEAIKWGNPVYESPGKVWYPAAGKDYVSLGFFYGAALTRPSALIEGTGKKMRHAKVRSAQDVRPEALAPPDSGSALPGTDLEIVRLAVP